MCVCVKKEKCGFWFKREKKLVKIQLSNQVKDQSREFFLSHQIPVSLCQNTICNRNKTHKLWMMKATTNASRTIKPMAMSRRFNQSQKKSNKWIVNANVCWYQVYEEYFYVDSDSTRLRYESHAAQSKSKNRKWHNEFIWLSRGAKFFRHKSFDWVWSVAANEAHRNTFDSGPFQLNFQY